MERLSDSSGMGLETAFRRRDRGLDLILLSGNPEKLERAKTELSDGTLTSIETVAVGLFHG